MVVDHGKIYLSEHLMDACARLGISVQPAGFTRAPTRPLWNAFSGALSEQLLAALPGYKGPDVYRRGKNPEEQAFYFLDELRADCPAGRLSATTGNRTRACASPRCRWS